MTRILILLALMAPAGLRAETVVHADAMDMAMRCVCQTHPNKEVCTNEPDRRQRVERGMEVVVSLAQEYHLPPYARPILAAVACGESGFNEHPTCGADDACVQECFQEKGWTWERLTPKQLHFCSTTCGGTEGCNDSGTSAGPFQIKWGGELGRLARDQGVSLYDYEQAGRFYLEHLLNAVRTARGHPAAKRLYGDCGRLYGQDRWSVALLRLGRGPTLIPGRSAVVWDSTTMQMVKRTRKRVPRCRGQSKYATWAFQWAAPNPDVWLPQETLAGR